MSLLVSFLRAASARGMCLRRARKWATECVADERPVRQWAYAAQLTALLCASQRSEEATHRKTGARGSAGDEKGRGKEMRESEGQTRARCLTDERHATPHPLPRPAASWPGLCAQTTFAVKQGALKAASARDGGKVGPIGATATWDKGAPHVARLGPSGGSGAHGTSRRAGRTLSSATICEPLWTSTRRRLP